MRKFRIFLLVMVVAAAAGTLLGKALQGLFPAGSPFYNFLGVREMFGFYPKTVDLLICEITIGFLVKFSVITVLFVLAAAYIFFSFNGRRKKKEPEGQDGNGETATAG